MKKINQLSTLKYPIDYVWQVRISQKVWDRIVAVAVKKKTTYSWIVRYCTFRLCCTADLKWNDGLLDAFEQIKPEKAGKTHRLQLCLYGHDVKIIQMIANMLEISISDLIRIALYLYLKLLEEDKVEESDFYWNGIKLVSCVIPKRLYSNGRLLGYFHEIHPFSWEDYSNMHGKSPGVFSIPGMTSLTRERYIIATGCSPPLCLGMAA